MNFRGGTIHFTPLLLAATLWACALATIPATRAQTAGDLDAGGQESASDTSVILNGGEVPRRSLARDSAPVELPFGFTWGQTRDDVVYLLKGIGVRVIAKSPVGESREAWTLDGFIKPLLQGVTLYFTQDYLEEVELQFGSEQWDSGEYTRLRRKMLLQFNRLYGPNRLISNERAVKDEVLQKLIGYEWTALETRLRLFDFEATRQQEQYRSVSVHYKYYEAMEVAERD